MKLIVNLTIVISCLLFFIPATAQVTSSENTDVKASRSSSKTDYSISNVHNSGTGLTDGDELLGEKCSMYYNKWCPGKVILKDNTIIEDRILRYNIYNQQMQFIVDDDTSAFGNPEEIAAIVIDDHIFVYDEFMCEKNEKRQGYLELLVDGDCKLYLHRCISYRYVGDCAPQDMSQVTEEYYLSKKFLISENGAIAVVLPEKRKALIGVLSDDSKDLNSYIKTKKIKLNDEEDLSELISYYNEN